MPGIAGLISPRPPDECRRLVEQMIDCMTHEKFYVSGYYSVPELGVFAGRVALEGSFSDCQPVLSAREDVALLFAGECFSGAQNAAALIPDYERSGDRFFAELNGLFSGLLIDRHQHRAFLFNDRYGMERIYYHEGRDGFFFSSEAKALLRILPELRAFDEEGLAQFLRYGCTLEWRTLFRDISLLPGASLWSFTGNEGCEKRRYFVPASWESQAPMAAEPFERELEESFARVLPRYFDSGRKIGVSLTGGLDTRMIMACRPEAQQALVSYTFAGRAGDTIDVQLAARVAAACRVPHHILRIRNDFFSNFASLADRTVYITDGCFGVCGAHEIYLNHQARGLAPVRLTGNFGSEIFRGATTFKPLDLAADLFHPDLRRELLDQRLFFAKAPIHPVSFAAFKEIPWNLFGVARAAQSQITGRTPYLDNELVALAFQAPDELRKSPAPALRVVRNSAAGLDLIRTDTGLLPASPLYSSVASLWYRSSFKLDYWRNEGLPHRLSPFDALLSRFHVLFGAHRYLHYRQWFRTELAGYLRERLTDSQTLRSELWNRRFLDQLAESHIKGRKNYLREINTVLTCAAIDRLMLCDSGASASVVGLR